VAFLLGWLDSVEPYALRCRRHERCRIIDNWRSWSRRAQRRWQGLSHAGAGDGGFGFLPYLNSQLNVHRLAFSTDLSHGETPLDALTRIQSPTRLVAIDVLPTFTEENLALQPADSAAAVLAPAGPAYGRCRRRRWRGGSPVAATRHRFGRPWAPRGFRPRGLTS